MRVSPVILLHIILFITTYTKHNSYTIYIYNIDIGTIYLRIVSLFAECFAEKIMQIKHLYSMELHLQNIFYI